VRDLNRQARKDVVDQTVANCSCHLVCLQETRLDQIDTATTAYLGGFRLSNYAFKPAAGVLGNRGGLLLLWNNDHLDVSEITIGEFHISATFCVRECGTLFRLTNVYRPSRHNRKLTFLREMESIKPPQGTKWMIVGDFNLIYKATDKNNRNLNR
jgi:exonuclease III